MGHDSSSRSDNELDGVQATYTAIPGSVGVSESENKGENDKDRVQQKE